MAFNAQGFTEAAEKAGFSPAAIQAEIAKQASVGSGGATNGASGVATTGGGGSALIQSIQSGASSLSSFTPTQQAQIVNEASRLGIELPSLTEDVSVSEKKEDKELETVGNVVGVLLKQFKKVPSKFTGPIVGNLASTVPFISAEARRFEKTRAGIAGAIKKIVGESGRLTDQDIDRIKNLIPSVNETKKEQLLAISGLKDFLEAKGVPLPKEFEQFGGEAQQPQEPQSLQGRGFLEKLFSLQGSKQFLQEAPGIAGRGVVAAGQNIHDLLRGDIGAARQRSEEFRPQVERVEELKKASQGEIQAKGETLIGLMAIKSLFTKGAAKLLKDKPAKFGQDILEKGLKTAETGGNTRKSILAGAAKSGKKIDGTALFNSVKEWAKRAKRANPTQSKSIDKFVLGMRNTAKGKKLNAKVGFELWEDANKGFSSAGRVGNTVEAGFPRALRDHLRGALDKVAPGFDEATKLIRTGLQQEKLVGSVRTGIQRSAIKEGLQPTSTPLGGLFKGTGRGIAKGAAQGAGLFAIAKLLGLRVPGAFSED